MPRQRPQRAALSLTPRAVCLAPLFAAGALACGSGEVPPSILLLTLDTTRTDALSCYGGAGASTTNLDRLAEEGIVFDSAFTSTPLTLPAHASILTGLYPIRHGVRDNGMGSLPPAARTLAELTQDADYRTAAFVSSVVLDSAFGLDQGFEVYDAVELAPDATDAHDTGDAHGERPAREVVDGALAWLATLEEDDPFFLWLHFYDPHSPYEARENFGCGPGSSASPGASNRPRYLSEVCDMDGEIGRVLSALENAGATDRTIILAVGDHGEAFGEHGEFGHSAHCFDTTLRVPMILRYPDARRAGTRRADIVSVVDVMPSLALAAGLATDNSRIDGLEVFETPAAEDRGVYFESYYGYLSFGWSPIAGWLDAAGKYIHTSEPSFFLPGDTEERDDRIEDLQDLGLDVRRYQRAVAELADASRLPRDDTVGSDVDLLENLRGLGYVAVGAVEGDLPSPLGNHELPSPTAMAEHYERSIDALALTEKGQFAEAIVILQGVRDVNPQNPFVLDLLGNCLLQEKRYPEAAGALRDLVDFALTPQPSAWARLGAVLLQLGKEDEGIEALERSLELSPGRPRVLRELIGTLERAGRSQEAATYRQQLRKGQG